jgi:hypothetical protein
VLLDAQISGALASFQQRIWFGRRRGHPP